MASRLARALRAALQPARRPTNLERICGWAFLVFTLLQVPCFLVYTATGHVALSPLQICAAHLTAALPEAHPVVEAVMLPGSWFRNAVGPWLRCLGQTHLQGPCNSEVADLGNWSRVAKLQRTELSDLQKLTSSRDMRPQDAAILYGSAIIVVSALFALVHTVKLSLAGFFLLFSGIYQAGHNVLPPFVLMLFLCGFAALRLDNSCEVQPAATLARSQAAAEIAAAGKARISNTKGSATKRK